jgi:hypothetical protein
LDKPEYLMILNNILIDKVPNQLRVYYCRPRPRPKESRDNTWERRELVIERG